MVSLKKKKPEIDLKKDRETGLDLEKKVDIDADSGGIGISFDVTELENGDKISIGYEVEAPIQVGVDYNVSSNELGLSGGLEAPGDLVGLSGGVTIDLNSGEISGGELGVALGGVEVSIGEGKCERTISISIAGVTTTYTQKKDNPDCGEDDEPEPPKGEDDDVSMPDPPPIDQIPGDPYEWVTAVIGQGVNVSFFEESSADGSLLYSVRGELIGTPSASVNWEEGVTDTSSFSYKESGSIPMGWQRSYGYPVRYQADYWSRGTQSFFIGLSDKKNNGVYTFTGNGTGGRSNDPNGAFFTDNWNYLAGAGPVYHQIWYVNARLQERNELFEERKTDGYQYKRQSLVYQVLLDYYKHSTGETMPPPPPKPPIPPIQPPEKEDMSCCDLEPVLSLLRKMSKVLAIDEMDGEGVKIPKRLFVPNGKGYEECKTYPKLMATQIRIADHLGIHPYKAQIDDSNAAQAGNQKLEVQVVNATAAAKMISELLLENKGDAATRLNLLVRNTVATGQILNAVAIAAKRIREVMRFLSIPVKEQIDYINMPFDFSFGNRDKKKGFQAGAKPNEALDINTEEATEKMLPKFMVNSKQPYVVEIFDDKQGTLLDILLKQSK